MTTMEPLSILFVCRGNICRSTMAEAVVKHLVAINPTAPIGETDSAGTNAYSLSPTDRRTLEALAAHDIGPYDHASQQVRNAHFGQFDLILGMDHDNVAWLQKRREELERAQSERGPEGAEVLEPGRFHSLDAVPQKKLAAVGLLGDFDAGQEIPDPYALVDGFEECYRMIRRMCERLVVSVEKGDWRKKIE